MSRREFAPQSVIVREATAADAAFVVLSGLVAVRRKDPDSGIEFLLAELGPDQPHQCDVLISLKDFRSRSTFRNERRTGGEHGRRDVHGLSEWAGGRHG